MNGPKHIVMIALSDYLLSLEDLHDAATLDDNRTILINQLREYLSEDAADRCIERLYKLEDAANDLGAGYTSEADYDCFAEDCGNLEDQVRFSLKEA